MYQQLLTKVLGVFDIPSGPIVGMWSLMMLLGCGYSIWVTKQVSMPVAMVFSAVLTNFCAHKIARVCGSGSASAKPDDDKNIDVNGDDDDSSTDKLSK
jgi:hypothetical protein